MASVVAASLEQEITERIAGERGARGTGIGD
jgi:hypothetical protein